MTWYIENPKDATRKLQEFINEFSKVQNKKLMKTNFLQFHTLTTDQKKKVSKKNYHQISIIINYQITINLASKRIKRQGTSLPKEANPYS